MYLKIITNQLLFFSPKRYFKRVLRFFKLFNFPGRILANGRRWRNLRLKWHGCEKSREKRTRRITRQESKQWKERTLGLDHWNTRWRFIIDQTRFDFMTSFLLPIISGNRETSLRKSVPGRAAACRRPVNCATAPVTQSREPWAAWSHKERTGSQTR